MLLILAAFLFLFPCGGPLERFVKIAGALNYIPGLAVWPCRHFGATKRSFKIEPSSLTDHSVTTAAPLANPVRLTVGGIAATAAAMREYAAKRGWTIALRLKRLVRARQSVSSGRICLQRRVGAGSMWGWSGGSISGARLSSPLS